MIKVIGAGLFRTGTLSLKEALEMLGFHKTYHFKEISAYSDLIFTTGSAPLTN